MVDETFVKERVQRGIEAGKKAESAFAGLSVEQLNWKPAPKSWSVAECLDHLIVANSTYFQQLERIAAGNFIMTTWEKWSPFSRLIGWSMKDSLQEKVKINMNTPPIFRPSSSQMDRNVLTKFEKNLNTFLDLMTRCAHVDLDKTVITSPSISIVTYTLRDTFQFLMEHEHRHINQAIRVKVNPLFPKIIAITP
jgi:hypothetical protein